MIKSIFTLYFLLTTTFLVAQTIVHQELFGTGLGTWSQVSITDPTDIWSAPAGYAEMNGFGGADDEDWLISPSIDLTTQAAEYLLFDYNDNFTGNLIEIYYSTDYNGGGTIADVQSASWQQLNDRLINIAATSCFTTLFQRHPAIDISAINGTNVYFAFKYVGTASSAKRYYIDNVRILADYYASISSGLYCCDLNSALNSLISVQSDRIRYTSTSYDVWDAMLHTDVRLNDIGTDTIMWDMFTDIPSGAGDYEFDPCNDRDLGSFSTCSTCYNREHSFPKSWWGGGTTLSDTAYTDMHHLVPSDRSLNSAKSNQPPGVVVSATTIGTNGFKVGGNASYPCSTINYFEPIDEYKGDYARIYFFMATRYKHLMSAWETLNFDGDCALSGDSCTAYEPWLINVLLDWHAADPVSQKEIDRNNAVFAIQGNRNPFIDNPTWVNLIWGDHLGNTCSSIALPVELISFEGEIIDGNAVLAWSTASEINNDYFELQKSADGISWIFVDIVQGSGTGSALKDYRVIDYNFSNDQQYYRLKQIDFNGEFKYSQIIYLNNEINTIYPNPTSGRTTFSHNCNKAHQVYILDQQGRKIKSFSIDQKATTIDLSDLKNGIYFVRGCQGVQRLVF